MKPPSILIAAPLLLALVAGCQSVSPGGSSVSTGQSSSTASPIAATYLKEADLQPGVPPPTAARVLLRGTEIPVVLQVSDDNDLVHFNWVTEYGVEVESEAYLSNEQGFYFVEAPLEKFDPPMPLVEYPLEIGKEWKWSGYVIYGRHKYPAKADLVAARETLNLPTGHAQALRIDVHLVYDANSPERTVRELKFWFEPGKGLIKREFHDGSTREPRPSTDDSL